jgi:protein-tyrosine-phosphatase
MVKKYDLVLGLTRTHQRFMALSAEDASHVVTWKTWERLLGIYGFDGSAQPHYSFAIPGADFSNLTVQEAHRAVMKRSIPEVSSLVEKYSSAVDVSDPWGYDLGVFEEMADDMDEAAHRTIQYVKTLELLAGASS